MTSRTRTLLWAGLLAAAGCTGGGPGQSGSPGGPAPGVPSSPAAGGDAAYTIMLQVFNDPVSHVRDAEAYKARLERENRWTGLLAVHKAGHSELFWGRYPNQPAAEKDLTAAKPLFPRAIVVPLPGKDVGPPEWNLKNAQGDFSLLVAVYKDDPSRNYYNRKEKALYSCRGLRDKNVDAYYYHGDSTSHVTIGIFGPNSVRMKLSPVTQQLEQEVLDPRIGALRKEFPDLLVNGNTVSQVLRDPRTQRIVRKQAQQTHLIRIPHDEPQVPETREAPPDPPRQPEPWQGPRTILRP